MTNLSNEARALLGCLWGNMRFTLRYAMVEQVPSDQAEAALGELVAAGILSRTADTDGSITFALTPAGETVDRKVSMSFLKLHGRFPMAQPKGVKHG